MTIARQLTHSMACNSPIARLCRQDLAAQAPAALAAFIAAARAAARAASRAARAARAALRPAASAK